MKLVLFFFYVQTRKLRHAQSLWAQSGRAGMQVQVWALLMVPPAPWSPCCPPDPGREASRDIQGKKIAGRKEDVRGRGFGKGRITPEKHIPHSVIRIVLWVLGG